MSRRKLLAASVIALFAVGFMAASIPFIESIKPSAKAGATLLHINIASLNDGEYVVQQDPVSSELKE